eukprot:403360597
MIKAKDQFSQDPLDPNVKDALDIMKLNNSQKVAVQEKLKKKSDHNDEVMKKALRKSLAKSFFYQNSIWYQNQSDGMQQQSPQREVETYQAPALNNSGELNKEQAIKTSLLDKDDSVKNPNLDEAEEDKDPNENAKINMDMVLNNQQVTAQSVILDNDEVEAKKNDRIKVSSLLKSQLQLCREFISQSEEQITGLWLYVGQIQTHAKQDVQLNQSTYQNNDKLFKAVGQMIRKVNSKKTLFNKIVRKLTVSEEESEIQACDQISQVLSDTEIPGQLSPIQETVEENKSEKNELQQSYSVIKKGISESPKNIIIATQNEIDKIQISEDYNDNSRLSVALFQFVFSFQNQVLGFLTKIENESDPSDAKMSNFYESISKIRRTQYAELKNNHQLLLYIIKSDDMTFESMQQQQHAKHSNVSLSLSSNNSQRSLIRAHSQLGNIPLQSSNFAVPQDNATIKDIQNAPSDQGSSNSNESNSSNKPYSQKVIDRFFSDGNYLEKITPRGEYLLSLINAQTSLIDEKLFQDNDINDQKQTSMKDVSQKNKDISTPIISQIAQQNVVPPLQVEEAKHSQQVPTNVVDSSYKLGGTIKDKVIQ